MKIMKAPNVRNSQFNFFMSFREHTTDWQTNPIIYRVVDCSLEDSIYEILSFN